MNETQDEITRHLEGAHCISENKRGEDVERRLLGHAQERGKDDLFRLLLDHFHQGGALDFLVLHQLPEHGGLENAEADP